MEVRSAEGTPYRAHGLILMAGSDYFAAAFTKGWADASGPHVLTAVPAQALGACLEWIYTGTCVAHDDQVLYAILEAAIYLQITSLVDEATRPSLLKLLLLCQSQDVSVTAIEATLSRCPEAAPHRGRRGPLCARRAPSLSRWH